MLSPLGTDICVVQHCQPLFPLPSMVSASANKWYWRNRWINEFWKAYIVAAGQVYDAWRVAHGDVCIVHWKRVGPFPILSTTPPHPHPQRTRIGIAKQHHFPRVLYSRKLTGSGRRSSCFAVISLVKDSVILPFFFSVWLYIQQFQKISPFLFEWGLGKQQPFSESSRTSLKHYSLSSDDSV